MFGSAASKAIAFTAFAVSVLATGTASGQSPIDQFIDGCFRACSRELQVVLRPQDVGGACDRYCACSLDELRARLSPHQAATLDVNPTDPASLKVMNAARVHCAEKVLLPLMKQ